MFDLDGYLARIGHAGDRAPTLDTLRAIHLAHARSIGFENLDPLCGRTPSLDADALVAKLVHGGRGGWCFEHNGLLRHALTALGFRTTALAARVLWNARPGAQSARGHMALLVHLDDGDHLADVGFGGLTLTTPLRLVADVEQPTSHEPFRLLREPGSEAGEWILQARPGDAWSPLYRFDLQPQLPPDYEVTNWYLSTNPRSPFTHMLMAARPAQDRRYALRDNVLTVRHLDGRSEQRVLGSGEALRAVLGELFLVRVPDDAAFAAVLDRLATGDAAPPAG